MKFLISLFLLLVTTHVSSQICFDKFFDKGTEAHQNKQFSVAISNFDAASICPDANLEQQKQAKEWMNTAEQDYISELKRATSTAEEATGEALKAKTKLEQQLIIDQANYKAFLVERELERDNVSYAFQLAKEALNAMQGHPSPNVLNAFGNAVYHQYTIRPFEQQYRFHQVALIPNSNNFLGVTNENELIIWNNQGRLIKKIRPHNQYIWSTSFSKDGDYIITTSADSTASLIHLSTKEAVKFIGHQNDVLSATFSPTGTQLITTSRDSTAILWNSNGERIRHLIGHQASIFEATFSPEGQYILTRSTDKTVILWNNKGDRLATLDQHKSYIHTAVFSPNQPHIITSATDNTTFIWDFDGKIVAKLTHEDYITACNFSPNGEDILTTSADKTIKLWDNTGTLSATLSGHRDKVIGATFAPDNQSILSWSNDNALILWNKSGQSQQVFAQHTAPIITATFSPSGKYILSGAKDKTVKLWDLAGRFPNNPLQNTF